MASTTMASTMMAMCLSFSPPHWASHPDASCEDKCATAGHCCVGASSGCQKPSCAMGCLAADYTASEAACNATCVAAGGKKPGSSQCTYALPKSNITFEMCGDCPTVKAPSWWPASIAPPAGQDPEWWPPGYSLPHCSSCDSVDGDPIGECKLGCMLAFRPSLKPTPPPKPEPPAPRPPPPPCGVFDCVVGGDVNFSSVFSSSAVLQAKPAQAAVYGYLGLNATAGAKVTVTVTATDCSAAGGGCAAPYSLSAEVDAASGTWKSLLPAHAAGGAYTVSARCDGGCTGVATIVDVTFGDVWYCAGQSNMALPLQFTYARNATYAAIKRGALGDVRLFGLKGNMNEDRAWVRALDAAGGASNGTMPGYGERPLDHFSSTCFYFGQALKAGGVAAPLGLVHTAWGGSMIEEWLTNDAVAACNGADVQDHNGLLYDTAVRPFLGTSLKGWVWYQGENNAGGLHGNVGTTAQPASGYACLMAQLPRLWRSEWSATPGTTDAAAPFGIVSLSAHDSEGAADMASFRWAQTASYGAVPNAALPNTFLAHAFDLQDPWSGDSGACEAPDAPLAAQYDCHTPW